MPIEKYKRCLSCGEELKQNKRKTVVHCSRRCKAKTKMVNMFVKEFKSIFKRKYKRYTHCRACGLPLTKVKIGSGYAHCDLECKAETIGIIPWCFCGTCKRPFIPEGRDWTQYCSPRCSAIDNHGKPYRQYSDIELVMMRINDAMSGSMRQALRGNKAGRHWETLIGYTLNKLTIHLERQFRAGMDWGNYGRNGWHIDHITACSKFDMSDPKQQELCFNFKNLQPLWAEDNYKKGTKSLKDVK